jgi:hypothetical protein
VEGNDYDLTKVIARAFARRDWEKHIKVHVNM